MVVVALGVFLDDGVDECQATPFAPERTLADACEVAVVVETVFAELCHHTPVFHLSVFHDEVEEEPLYRRRLVD